DRRGREVLEAVPGEDLRDLILAACTHCGGIVPRARYKRDLGAPFRWQRKRWQRFLEDGGLGTVTTLGLGDCGVELEGETTVIFAEVAERILEGLSPDPVLLDRTASARVDLLTDLSHFLRYVASHPIRVTHGRTIHRAAYGRILDGLTFREDALVERTEVFQVVYDLSLSLGLVEAGEDRMLVLTRLGQGWDGIPLPRKVRTVYERFLDERRADLRDFHERPLRRLLAGRLARLPAGEWAGLRTLPFLARNDYLAGLEEEGVRAAYRNRFQQTFDPPREEPNDLAEALVDWTIGRLYLLGLVDVGFSGQEPAAVRLTDQGRRLMAGGEEAAEGGNGASLAARPLVVNPDFEVLLLPEGDVNEVAHTLDRFARRVRSDEVTRYRLQREEVERAVVQGMTVEEILAFLEERSRSAVPQNVSFSVREWGERVRFARQREAVLLEVDREDALDRALTLEPVRSLLLARLGPKVAALRGTLSDHRTLEALKGLGVYFRG
ncbi:MAG: helicase-associated domain-containing protein, partial [Planctomycetaceae bacterium]|nr:helicase-associated domain-containing protein [Planctomycetaceae bacterium]